MVIKAELYDDAIKTKVTHFEAKPPNLMVKWLEDKLDVKGKLTRHISGHDQSTVLLLRSG